MTNIIAELKGFAGLELVTRPSTIRRKIINAIAEQLQPAVAKAIPKVRSQFQNLIYDTLTKTTEYRSLTQHGQLQKHFGLDNPVQRLEGVIGRWLEGMEVKNTLRKHNKFIAGGIKVNMFQADFGDVTGLPEAQVMTEKGELLPWLDWLLTFGDQTIIVGYRVMPSRPSARRFSKRWSRTGLSIMVSSGKRPPTWRVPPEFSGTANNNWITRAFARKKTIILEILQNAIESVI